MLVVALMPHHAPDLSAELCAALGGPDQLPRRSYVLALLNDDREQWESLDKELDACGLLTRGLLVPRGLDDGDERFVVSLALLEFYGMVD